MQSKILQLLLLTFASLMSLAWLVINYQNNQAKLSYPFIRTVDRDFKNIKKFNLGYNSFHIAGCYDSTIYLGNVTAPLSILKINLALTDTMTQHIQLPNEISAKQGIYYLQIDDEGYFYLQNGKARDIIYGKVKDGVGHPSKIYCPFFQQSVPINKTQFAYKYVNFQSNSNSLRVENLQGSRKENNSLLETHVDGLFCTSGFLDFSTENNLLSYTYFYRNTILLVDTNLNLVKKLKTIDPIDSTFLKVSRQKDGSFVTTTPPLRVNNRSAFWGKYLLVHSDLMGQGEDLKVFQNSIALDIYNIQTSKYIRSIYLPKQTNEPIRQFRVINGFIFVMADKSIFRYSVNLPL